MIKFITIMLSIPKTLYWNLKLYGILGYKMPILIHYSTILNINGKMIFPPFEKVNKTFSSKIGFGGSPGIVSSRCNISISREGMLSFKGNFNLSQGNVIRVEKDGKIEIGNNFYANKNCFFLLIEKLRLVMMFSLDGMYI